MHLLIVTDAWTPQVNGVVRTLERLVEELERTSIRVDLLTPAQFRSIPCPTYPEIRLALTTARNVSRKIEAVGPDHLHIATEGPLGIMARAWALSTGHRFTTSYHTRFPEYVAARLPIPLKSSYWFMRRFHNAGAGCMVATESLERDLEAHGFRNLMRWTRGVDHRLFNPDHAPTLDLPRPIFMTVGRVAVEKNIAAFLELDLPGTKVVVGDGPARADLQQRFPEAVFTGAFSGPPLAALYASADVFVFPSRTDTFGNVLLEALACGVPVAAFPVMGPLDVIGTSGAGVLDEDLRAAALAALEIPRARAREHALRFTWEESTRSFMGNVVRAMQVPPPPATPTLF